MYFCWLEFWDGFVHPWLQQNQTHPVMKGLMSFLWLFDLTKPPQAERRRVSSTQTHTHECVTQDYSAQCYLIKSGKSTRGKDKLKQKIINWAQSHRDGETQTHMNIQPHFKHTYINYKKIRKVILFTQIFVFSPEDGPWVWDFYLVHIEFASRHLFH